MDPTRLQTLLDPLADDEERLRVVYEMRAAEGIALPEWANSDEVLDALTRLASNEDEAWIHNEAAEALVQVWLTKGTLELPRYRRLSNSAKEIVRSYVELNRPDLLGELTE